MEIFKIFIQWIGLTVLILAISFTVGFVFTDKPTHTTDIAWGVSSIIASVSCIVLMLIIEKRGKK